MEWIRSNKKYLIALVIIVVIVALGVALVPYITNTPHDEPLNNLSGTQTPEPAPPRTVEELLRRMSPSEDTARSREVSSEVSSLVEQMTPPQNKKSTTDPAEIDALLKRMNEGGSGTP